MTTVKIGDQTSTYVISEGNTTYLLQEGKEIVTDSKWGGISADSIDTGNTVVRVDGMISGMERGVYMGYDADVTGNSVIVGEFGSINATFIGINGLGNDLTVLNQGTISVHDQDGYGIAVEGDGARITNTGDISVGTGTGIKLEGAHGTIINSGDIVASDYGVQSYLYGVKLVNSGTITGDGSFLGGIKNDTVINSGTMNGEVDLYDGNDVFRSKGGHVNGVVDGGDGDDRYYVDSAKIELQDNSGYDRVYSSVSWTLGEFFAEGHLTGKGNTKLIGNDFGNTLIGNVGNNRIIGHLGGDAITGGRGNDVLTGDDSSVEVGDGGPDVFIFKNHSGKDVITDFHNGEDAFTLMHYKGIDDFSDLKGHITQSGDDVVVSLLDGDQFILRDTHKADIDASDFAF